VASARSKEKKERPSRARVFWASYQPDKLRNRNLQLRIDMMDGTASGNILYRSQPAVLPVAPPIRDRHGVSELEIHHTCSLKGLPEGQVYVLLTKIEM
jgi:hypothetical protein